MKNNFITGLVLIIPFTLAILLTVWVFNVLSTPFYFLFHAFLQSVVLSNLLSFLSAILVIVATGYLAQYFIVKKAFQFFHRFMQKLPIVRNIYHSVFEVVSVLSREEKGGFSETVLIAYPYRSASIVGFIPRRDIPTADCFADLVPVFIPGTVNPLMGFLSFTKSKYLKSLNINSKEAFIWNISVGGKDPFK